MCMLTVFPMPDLLDKQTILRLENGAWSNDDGHGWAVVSKGRILTGRSLNSDRALDDFYDAYLSATGPAIFHSRWATHGGENLDNCHPFPVGGMADTYVAHNGVLPSSAWPKKGDDRSDTRLFADNILGSQFGRLDSYKNRARLSDWLLGNKIAILTVNPDLRRNLYLFGMEMGYWEDGVWFSNQDYLGYGRWRHYAGASTGTGALWDEADEGAGAETVAVVEGEATAAEVCVYCDKASVNEHAVCEICGTCQDCLEAYRDCQCYFPRSLGGTGESEPGEDTRPYVLGPSQSKEVTAYKGIPALILHRTNEATHPSAPEVEA